MSTAPPALLAGLIDDAAVFPPGNAPLDLAVARHRAHRKAAYAGLVGPLLVPVADVETLVAEASGDSPPLAVGLIARPGVAPRAVADAVARLSDEASVEVVGAELGWFVGWRTLPVDGLPLTLEIPRGAERDRALDDVRAGVDESGRVVQAKFRTGATPTWEWPDETELAAFLRDCARLGVPFKLTGGLHHAVRAEHDGEPQHGLLNVLLAVHAAVHDGALVAVESLLAQRDPRLLTDAVLDLDDEAASRVRSVFTAYGCCEVTDPIGELDDLGVLDLAAPAPDEETPS
ncbi:hypothetical protein N798_06790 [Knoellia flava TL1]|uniref:Uncharacterized protein n=2 Tax=Knoellia flava TaxID=913969 RepID=A0A8H9FSV5_9MICO|nr:hypothetical protein [Knoellia flava]KGN33090.1 hypothetical protein N798_06790 [Knoellia flava TL1]GGB71071.1 hypothetical protein GCM10011314_08050 [Knoellia flava]